MKMIICLLFLGSLLLSLLNAQDQFIIFNKENTNAGLCDDTVNCISFDSLGNKWIGTRGCGGLKFDGLNWTVEYPVPDWTNYNATINDLHLRINDNWVNSIAVDHTQNKWFGQQDSDNNGLAGICKISMNEVVNYCMNYLMLQTNRVIKTAVDCENHVWLGTTYGLAEHYDNNDPPFTIAGLENKGIITIGIDPIEKCHNTWLGTWDGGLTKVYGSNIIQIPLPAEMTMPNTCFVNSIDFDKTGNIWLGTTCGLAKYERYEWGHYWTGNTGQYGLQNNIIKKIEVDANGFIWITTECGGLNRVSPNLTWSLFNLTGYPNLIPSNCLNPIAVDPADNSIWVGGWHSDMPPSPGGVSFLVNGAWNASFNNIPELHSNNISAISAIDNKIWIGWRTTVLEPWGGLVMYNRENETWTDYSLVSQCIAHKPYSIEKDLLGYIWVGTDGGGICVYDGIDWTTYNTQNSPLPDNVVHAIVREQKIMWIGTSSGLARWDLVNDPHIVPILLTDHCISTNNITCIAIDNDGNKWIGTDGGGLVKYDNANNVWSNFTTSNSLLTNDKVTSIAIRNDSLWIGTCGGGVVILREKDPPTWKYWNTSNSNIPDNNIKEIGLDNLNNVWVGMETSGLARFVESLNPPFPDHWTSQNSDLPDCWLTALSVDKNNNVWIGTWGCGVAVLKENGITGIENQSVSETAEFQVTPNPFSESTTINYELQTAGMVKIDIFSSLGEKITTLLDEWQEAGRHIVVFDVGTHCNVSLQSGIYFYRIQIGERMESGKMVLIK